MDMGNNESEEKLEVLLRLVLLQIFDLRIRIDAITNVLTESQRATVFETHRRLITDQGDELVTAFFSHLRAQTGAPPDHFAKAAENLSSEELWSNLHQAEKREDHSSHFERECERLWDTL